jgi:hypothetical protein
MLVTAAIATPENVFAYEKNQATSQTSTCGNDFFPMNTGCDNADSQIQGDENAAALTAQQTFPEVKLVQENPSPPPTTEPMPATLRVCKNGAQSGTLFVEGNNPSPNRLGLDVGECQDVTIGPGDYLVWEAFDQGEPTVFISGDCTDEGLAQATGNIQAGETQVCVFDNQPGGMVTSSN